MGMETGFQSPGALFQQERLWEQKIANRILSNMRAVQTVRKGVDPQLDGLYNQIPAPPELTEAKVWLRYRLAVAKSAELKRVITYIIKFVIKPLLDLFKRDPILVPSYWKEAATTPSEREYIFAPSSMVPPGDTFDDEAEATYGEDEVEKGKGFIGGIYDRTRGNFLGPSGVDESSYSDDEEEDEEVGL